MSDAENLTSLLRAWQGDPENDALSERLIRLVYGELKQIARSRLAREGNVSIQPTELVHEAWLKLKPPSETLEGREHFYRLASTVMRHLLVDQARERLSKKRGGDRLRVTLTSFGSHSRLDDSRFLDFDRALHRLSEAHPRPADVVGLRCFGGLTLEEVARELDIGLATVKRDWSFARAWLIVELREREP
jgi:RNA polymerase sigma factor (TIGR02999 family)